MDEAQGKMFKVHVSSTLTFRGVHHDITTVKADAVVTGESTDLKKESSVTRCLMSTAPTFRGIRQQLEQNHGRLEMWNVYTSNLGFPFKHVLHAVLDKGTGDEWLKNMKKLYTKIFKEADKLRIYTLALPLLGTGKAETDRSLAVKAMVMSVCEYSPNYLTDIMIVSKDIKVLDMLETQYLFEQSGMAAGKRNDGICKVLSRAKDFVSSVVNEIRNFDKGWTDECTADTKHEDYKNQHSTFVKKATKNHSHPSTKNTNGTHIAHREHAGGRGRGGKPRMHCHGGGDYHSHSDTSKYKYEKTTKGGKRGGHPRKFTSSSPGHRHAQLEEEELQKAIEKSKMEAANSKKKQQRNRRSVEEDPMFLLAMQVSKEGNGSNAMYEPPSGGQVDSDPSECDDSVNEDSDVNEDDFTDFDNRGNKFSINGRKEKENIHNDTDLTCSICLNVLMDPKQLDKCGHIFCKNCIDRSFRDFKPVCPCCNMVYGVITGNQPYGTMKHEFSSKSLPGYDGCGTITITYHFPSGIQKEGNPNPGQPYKGTTRTAYLPDCREGREILKLLRTAFDRKLTFTIGRSTTTGKEGVVTYNDIHHKTSMDGGPTRFGYPDPTYLSRVRDELASKGVTS